MFSNDELLFKEKAFDLSKLRFETMDNFLNEKTTLFKDIYTNYSYIFITIARFITYKEDIWKKNKKTKTIATNFSKEILDDFLFNGKFTSTKIDFKERSKQNNYSATPITINTILKGKEKDSVWIIDNIRDSIAHGHYYIDFNTNNIIVKNNHEDRLLDCSIKFDLFAIFNELITEERIGGYTNKKLTTPPILCAFREKNKNPITNISNEYILRDLLKTDFIVSYCEVTDYRETDPNLGVPVDEPDTAYLVEVKDTRPTLTADGLLQTEPQRLYGIMTGDEGWQFVPRALAEERLSNHWGSRDFVRYAVFGNNGLFLNLNRSAMARDYLARQDQFGGWAYGGANDYFRVDSDLGGLCHGILHAQEMVLVIKTIAGRILNRQESYRKSRTGSISKSIRKVRFFRRELITTLDRVENLGIMEIGELEQLLLNSQKITPLIDSIKYLLELVEGELDLLYQQSTNRLVNILTVAGLLISGLSFAFSFL